MFFLIIHVFVFYLLILESTTPRMFAYMDDKQI